MKNKYVVSFCVPVYNRADVSYLLAKDLLANKDNRFQVVISDNNSSDKTIELLETIQDKRLKICKNIEGNYPATLNWYNALENGDGVFLYLVMGRDKLFSENIGKLIELLLKQQNENIGFMRDRGANEKCEIYSKVGAAIKFLDRDHPSGLIIKNTLWKNISNRKCYFCIEDYYYPENYIKGELLKVSAAALIGSGVYSSGKENVRVYIDKKKDKSKIVHNKRYCFIFPHNNLMYLKRITEIIESIGYNEEEISTIILRQYKKHLNNGIIHYGVDRRNEELCSHYNLKPRKVMKSELVYELFKFHFSYNYYLKQSKKTWYNMDFKRQMMEVMKDCWIEVINS